MLPLICDKYNKDNICINGPACHLLHVCLQYVTSKCQGHCYLSHQLTNTANESCLSEYGIEVTNEKIAKEFLKNWYGRLHLCQVFAANMYHTCILVSILIRMTRV